MKKNLLGQNFSPSLKHLRSGRRIFSPEVDESQFSSKETSTSFADESSLPDTCHNLQANSESSDNQSTSLSQSASLSSSSDLHDFLQSIGLNAFYDIFNDQQVDLESLV